MPGTGETHKSQMLGNLCEFGISRPQLLHPSATPRPPLQDDETVEAMQAAMNSGSGSEVSVGSLARQWGAAVRSRRTAHSAAARPPAPQGSPGLVDAL